MLKRKIILKKKDAVKLSEQIKDLKRFNTFSKELLDAPQAHHPGIIRRQYEDTFGCFPPWDKHPYDLVKTKLMYELLKLDHDELKIPLPEKARVNYEASRDFNLTAMTPGCSLL